MHQPEFIRPRVRRLRPDTLLRCVIFAALLLARLAGEVLTTIVKDSNAIGQGLSIDCIGVFADKSTISAEDIATLAQEISDQGFKLRRTDSVQATLLKLMECDVADPVVQALTKHFTDKVKKVPQACAECLTEALVQFGMGAMKSCIPMIRDSVSVLFSSSEAAVRQRLHQRACMRAGAPSPQLVFGSKVWCAVQSLAATHFVSQVLVAFLLRCVCVCVCACLRARACVP